VGSSHAYFYTMVHGILKPDEDLVAHVMTNLSNSSHFGALIKVWKSDPILTPIFLSFGKVVGHQLYYILKSGRIFTPIFLSFKKWSDSHTNFPNFNVHERLDIAIHIQFNIFVMDIIIIINTKKLSFS